MKKETIIGVIFAIGFITLFVQNHLLMKKINMVEEKPHLHLSVQEGDKIEATRDK